MHGHPRAAQQAGAPRRGQWPCHQGGLDRRSPASPERSAGQCSTVRYVWYRWCDAGMGGRSRGRVAFRAPGVCPAPPLWLWAQCSLASLPGVRVQSHAFHSVALRAVGCFVASYPPLPCALGASCRCRLLGALIVCFRSVLLVRARGPALRLGVCLLGLPAVACAVSPIPTIASLCDTKLQPKTYSELQLVVKRMGI